jgi:hypothetical protein
MYGTAPTASIAAKFAYHHERNHQGLDNVIPLPFGQPGKGAIRRHERLGGVLGHYRRAAA